jgi:LysM repeat protein
MLLPRIPHLLRLAGCCLALVLGAGCDLLHRGETDERREANFQTGYNQALQGLFDDAIRSYQRALDANPRNAIAHRELGFLLRDRKHDYVTSVYHLRRCQEILASRNDRDAKDPTIDDAIRQAQLQLAIEFSSQIGQQQTQSRTDELKRRNAELEATVQRLTQQLASYTQAGLRPGASNVVQPLVQAPAPAPVTNAAPAPRVNPPSFVGPNSKPLTTHGTTPGASAPAKHGATTPTTSTTSPSAPVAKAAKTHVVRSGDTPALIARSHGITLQQLMAANRNLDPKRLKVGQTLNLPDGAR